MKPRLSHCGPTGALLLCLMAPPAAVGEAAPGAKADAALKPLETRLRAAGADREAVRRDLLAFRRRYPGTPASLRAAEFLSRLPSPLDALDAASIDADDRWEGQPKELVAILKGHARAAAAVAFSPDGDTLASSGWENTVRLWKFAGAAPKEWATVPGSPSGLAFAPDGRTLAAGTSGKSVQLWDLTGTTPRALLRLGGHTQRPFAVAWSPDGKLLATGCLDPRLRVWKIGGDEPEAWAVLAGERLPTEAVASLAFSPDGQRLAAGGFVGKHSLLLWDVSGTTMDEVPLPESQAHLVAFAPDGTLASHGKGGGIAFWDVRSSPPRERALLGGVGPKAEAWTALAFTPDGRVLASAGLGRKVVVWQAESARRLLERQLPAEPRALAFAPDGRHLAVAAADGAVYILRLNFKF